MLADWDRQSEKHKHARRWQVRITCRYAAAGLPVIPTLPLSEPESEDLQEPRGLWSWKGGGGGRAHSYLSMTAQMSLIHHSIYSQPEGNITNQGISPGNNLMMWLKRTSERADCVCQGADSSNVCYSWCHFTKHLRVSIVVRKVVDKK